jgi:hypothetical protein
MQKEEHTSYADENSYFAMAILAIFLDYET